MDISLLQPVVVLVSWSLFMLVWMIGTRIPALKAAGISLKGRRGSRPGGLDGLLPDEIQWKAHNYVHLMEQPTLFYAIVLTLALLNAGDPVNIALAWGYALLRVAHSLVQATVNIITIRLALFALSSLCLIGLAARAAMTVFSG